MDGWMELLALVPEPPGWSIDWSAWKASVFHLLFAKWQRRDRIRDGMGEGGCLDPYADGL